MVKGRSKKSVRAESAKAPGGGDDGSLRLVRSYLALAPERDPRLLVTRSVLPIARGAFLIHGVMVQGWSVGWLAGFLAAELFLVLRLGVLGDRLAGGPQYDPEIHRRTSLGFQLAWLVVSLAAALFTGQALDRSAGGGMFGATGGVEGVERFWSWPSWGIVVYLTLLVVDFVLEGFAARRERRMFVPAGLLHATFFFVAILLLSFFAIVLAGFAGELFGDDGARGAFATFLVVARAGGELAVLWLPVWWPWFEARRARRRMAAS